MSEGPLEQPSAAATEPKPRQRKRLAPPRRMPMWHVILLDDNDHTHEYVIEMLKCIFAHPEPMGFRLAEEVDRTGRAVVYTCHRELAELKREQIHGFGADIRVATCQGSMTAVLEPADPD